MANTSRREENVDLPEPGRPHRTTNDGARLTRPRRIFAASTLSTRTFGDAGVAGAIGAICAVSGVGIVGAIAAAAAAWSSSDDTVYKVA